MFPVLSTEPEKDRSQEHPEARVPRHILPEELARAADYCGVYTGKKVNKFEKCGLTPLPAHEVACPIIAESPLSLECRVTQIIPLGSQKLWS